MENLKVFNNEEFGQVRTVEMNNEVYFVGKDVVEILGYQNGSRDINRHVDEEDRQNYQNGTFESPRGMTVINESGLYSLILGSKLESAKKFKRWVTSEVLPSIRQTGGYSGLSNAKADRSEIMLMNARSRMAQTYLKLAQVDTLSKSYKSVLVAKSAEVLAGEQILPLPKVEQKTYSAKEIGEMFGISANKVGRIANKHELKTEQYGEYIRDKSQYSVKEVDTWVYFETVLPVFEKLLNMEVA
jgi:Prophage antirepressor